MTGQHRLDYEVRERVAVIALNRPPVNAIDRDTSQALYDAFHTLQEDDGLLIGIITGTFDAPLLKLFAERLFGIMSNQTLVAIPLFVLMGVILERSKVAEELLENMGAACGRLPAGLGISVVLVGNRLE